MLGFSLTLTVEKQKIRIRWSTAHAATTHIVLPSNSFLFETIVIIDNLGDKSVIYRSHDPDLAN